MSEAIQVVVRCRPFNKKEIAENRGNAITMDLKGNTVFIANADDPDAPPKQFTFDSVFDDTTQQRYFYEESCFGLVENVLEGFNGTIFAYGQTGCGKTWTMQGPWSPVEMRGVIPNAFAHVFEFVNATKDVIFLVHCAYLEIYNEEIRDLLADQSVDTRRDLREDPGRGVFVNNLTDVVVNTEAEMDAVLNRGLSNRTVGATLMNSESSRSHSIFTIIIEMNYKTQTVNGKDMIKAGKLNLVDLAGSERQKKTGASGSRLKEGSKINLSLSALGNVISALSEGKSKHIPYRDSKLTRLLQDSLGGNTKTLMVAAISPADYNYDETLSTLRYANRAKAIKNKPKINEDPKDTLLREYREEIERLKALLAQQDLLLAQAGQAAGTAPSAVSIPSAAVAPAPSGDGTSSALASLASSPRGDPTSAPLDPNDFSEEIYRANPDDHSTVPGHISAEASPHSSPAVTQQLNVPVIVTDTKGISPVVIENIEDSYSESPVPPGGTPREKSPRKTPRETTAAKIAKSSNNSSANNTPRTEKVEVEVKVEVIPESHLDEQKALREYSKSVAQQRDQFGDLLKVKEVEMEEERLRREALNQKLRELENKLQGVFEDTIGEDGEIQTEAQKRHAERKARQKKRLEAKIEAEIKKTKAEKMQVESELDELKTTMENAETANRKLAKMKKKYERQMRAMENESEELREEFQAERDRLLDTIRDQTREMKLFEQICRAMAPDKELRKVLEKSRWDEEAYEWVLPFVKLKDVDSMLPTIGTPTSSKINLMGTSSNGGVSANSTPVSSSPRMSAVVALPNAQPTKYDANNSPRSNMGIADEEEEGVMRRRGRTKSFRSEQEQAESQKSLTSLPISLVPKPPKSRSASRKKKTKRRNKEKQALEDDLTDFVTEDENDNDEEVVAGPVTDWGFNGVNERVPSRQKRQKTPGLPRAGKEKSSPRGMSNKEPSVFESLPSL